MPVILKYGSLNLLEPSGPVQVCTRVALPRCHTTETDHSHKVYPTTYRIMNMNKIFSIDSITHTHSVKLQGFFYYWISVDVFLNIRNNEWWIENWVYVEGNGLTWFKMSSWNFLAGLRETTCNLKMGGHLVTNCALLQYKSKHCRCMNLKVVFC